jgi:DNA polymerase III epsilon subunit-like protein
MIAHNSPFDTKFLDFELRRNGFSQRPGDWTSAVNIVSFVDSVALLRDKKIWTERKNILGLPSDEVYFPASRRLGALHEFVLGRPISGAHNAIADVTALEDILESPGLKDVWRSFANDIQYITIK